MDSRRGFLQTMLAGLGAPLTPCGAEVAAQEANADAGPMVGSLFPFIESQAVHGEFPLSFLRDEFRDLAEWKQQGRSKLLDLLHYDPPRCDPAAMVLERGPADGYTLERIEFNTTPDLRVPADVLIPDGLTKPAPAVVALHDHGGMQFWGREKLVDRSDEHPFITKWKADNYGGRGIASDLARRGYVVIVIDMFYWGERRIILDGDPADWRDRPADISTARIWEYCRRSSQLEGLVARTIMAAGFTWPGVMCTDDLRTVDYLVTRPEVDPARIGCVGLSVGGLRSCHLAALDDRIKAAVVVGWMASYPAQLREKINHTIGFTKLVPGLARHMDYPDVASLAMPSPLLVINGSQDGLFDLDGVKHCFAKLTNCYEKAGAPDHFRGTLYDTPHLFNLDMQREAWEWLARWV